MQDRSRVERLPGDWADQRWRKPAARVPQNHAWMLFVSGLRGAIAFALASSTIHDLGEKSGRVIRTATLMIIIFTVLVVGGACHEADGLGSSAPSRWTEVRDVRGIVGATRVRPRRRRRRGARRGAVQERTLRRRRRTK